MDQTTNLSLPFIMPSQAQKQVTHNQALQTLDAAVQLAVLDRDLSAPPASPTEGARYIVAPAGSAAWSGKDGLIAAWQNGAWSFFTPLTGWLAWVDDEGTLLYFAGTGWSKIETAIAVLQNLTELGIGTTADGTNPFSAKLNSALWTAKYAAEGGTGNLRYTMNKEVAADIVSLLLQTGYSGRAELGLLGDDNLTLKVSPDGSAWTTALTVNKSDGTTQFAGGSASAPGVKIGDTDSGLYGSGSVLRFAIDGVGVASFNQYGLGIGVDADASDPLIIKRTGGSATNFTLEGEGPVANGVRRYSGDAVGPTYAFLKNRGTIASPTVPLQNDSLGTINWLFFDAGGVARQPGMLAVSVIGATPGATDASSRMLFSVVPPGSTVLTEIMRLDHAAGLSMFGANPVIDQNRHHVLRVYTVAALPAAGTVGRMAYASNLRTFNGTGTQQGSGAGTGGLVIDNGSHWVNADAQSVAAVA